MKRRVPNLRGSEPLLDIVSYGRTGPRSLTRTERDYVDRTVRRAPEVVVKVSGGARTLAGVERHLDYVGRQGKLAMESDDGQALTGKGFQSDVILDWKPRSGSACSQCTAVDQSRREAPKARSQHSVFNAARYATRPGFESGAEISCPSVRTQTPVRDGPPYG